MENATQTSAWSGLEELRPTLALRLRGRCRDDSELDDLIQETFLRAARYRASLDADARLEPWLMRIARNVHTDAIARDRRRRREAGEELLDALEAREEPPGAGQDEVALWIAGEELERDRLLRLLVEALRGLRPEEVDALDGHYRRGEDSRTLAARLAVPQPMVKVRLYRARQRLRRHIERAVALDRGRRQLALGVSA